MNVKGKRRILAQPPQSTRPRKLGVVVKNDEFYSEQDLAAIREGREQINCGEWISHEDLKRREGL